MSYEEIVGALWRAALIRNDQEQAARLERALEAGPRPAPDWLTSAPYALWYAEHGWPVLPLSTGSKVPLKNTRGLLDATSDPAMVYDQFRALGTANIGLVTGERTYDVIDVDGPEGCESVIRSLNEDPDFVPVLAISQTPRGFHIWVPASGRGNTAQVWPGVDYRGNGGYVVAPPSRLLTEYEQSFLSESAPRPIYAHYRWIMTPEEEQ